MASIKLTLAEPKYLKDSITIVSELVNEGTFRISKDMIELVAMDPANVAMVVFKLFSSSFTEYKVDEKTDISVNLANLRQIMRRAKPTDMLVIEYDKGTQLKITLKGTSKRTFSLPIIDVEEKEQKVPDLDFPLNIKTTSTILNEAIEDVDVIAESVSFIAEPNTFSVKAEGDLSKADIEIPVDDSTNIIIDGSKFKSRYSIEYLKKIINGSKLSEDVSIRFGNDYPLRVEYGKVDKMNLLFILAPRVEND